MKYSFSQHSPRTPTITERTSSHQALCLPNYPSGRWITRCHASAWQSISFLVAIFEKGKASFLYSILYSINTANLMDRKMSFTCLAHSSTSTLSAQMNSHCTVRGVTTASEGGSCPKWNKVLISLNALQYVADNHFCTSKFLHFAFMLGQKHKKLCRKILN